MTKEDKEQLNIEISHIFESGANHLRIFEVVENFIDKRYKAINFTHCCTEFKTVDLDPEIANSLNEFCNKQGKKEPTKKRF